MKWFKHMSDASEDEFLSGLEAIFGWEGYGRWWKILEIIAKQMDKSDKCSACYPWSDWQRLLKGKKGKLEEFLIHCEKKNKIYLRYNDAFQVHSDFISDSFPVHFGNKTEMKGKQNGNVLEIYCPKLLEFRDEYSRKSGQSPDTTPDKVAPDIRIKKEDIRKEKKESIVRSDLFALTSEDENVINSKKGTRLSSDWELSEEWGEWAKKEYNLTYDEIILEESKFKDYWISRADKGAIKKDWFAVWRNWVRTTIERKNNGISQKKFR